MPVEQPGHVLVPLVLRPTEALDQRVRAAAPLVIEERVVPRLGRRAVFVARRADEGERDVVAVLTDRVVKRTHAMVVAVRGVGAAPQQRVHDGEVAAVCGSH